MNHVATHRFARLMLAANCTFWLLCSLMPADGFAEETGGMVLQFPSDRSLGRLYFAISAEPDGWRDVAAQGEVQVPKGGKPMLQVSQPACEDLSPLPELIREGLDNLILDDLQLTGENMEQIASLSGVHSLSFYNGNLADEDLRTLSKLRSLTSLTIGRAQITDEGFAQLESLANLEVLHVTQTGVTDQAWQTIGKFKSLKTLNVSEKNISDAGFVTFKDLPDLENLSFGMIRAVSNENLPHLATLAKLKTLSFAWNTRFGGNVAAELGKLKQLTRLDLSTTNISDEDMRHFRSMALLSDLTLPNSITDEGLAQLGPLPALTRLSSSGSHISEQGLAAISLFTQLEFLNISGDRITDHGMPQLAKLSKLKALYLQHCPVGDEGLAALAPLKSLEVLVLSSLKVTDDGLRHLRQFPKLTGLSLQDLAGGEGLAIGLRHLSALHELTSLELGNMNHKGAPLIDSDLDPIVSLKKLRTIDLHNFPLTDAGVERLLQLPAIETLQLDSEDCTRLTDDSLRLLSRMEKLTRLSLGGRFTDAGLESLANSPALRDLTIVSEKLNAESIAKLRKTMTVRAAEPRSSP